MAYGISHKIVAYAPRPTQTVTSERTKKSSNPGPKKQPPDGWEVAIGVLMLALGIGMCNAIEAGELLIAGGCIVGLYGLYRAYRYRSTPKAHPKVSTKKAWTPPRFVIRETDRSISPATPTVTIDVHKFRDHQIRHAWMPAPLWAFLTWSKFFKLANPDHSAQGRRSTQPLEPQPKFAPPGPPDDPTATMLGDSGDSRSWILIIILIIFGIYLIVNAFVNESYSY